MAHKENAPSREAEGATCLLGGDSGEYITAPITAQFSTPRDAALALLNSGARLTRKAGSFLGQLSVDLTPMTPAQSAWLATLLDRSGLPAFGGDA